MICRLNRFMQLIDAHCHLEAPQFDGEVDAVAARCKQKNVVFVVDALGEVARLQNLLSISRKHSFVKMALGVNPYDAVKRDWRKDLQLIKPHLQECVAIGEIGLDRHEFAEKDWPIQEACFIAQLELAEKLSLPVVVHSRKAESRVFEVLEDFSSVRVMLHCFLVHRFAERAAKNGFLVSLPTLKSKSRQKLACACEVVCETDSPFLSPNGGNNEPWKVLESYEAVAAARGEELEKCAGKINSLAAKFFGVEE